VASITTLLENLIIADLAADSYIGQFPIQPHDFSLLKSGGAFLQDEQPIVIVVTAYDQGDYDRVQGSGIRKLHLEVQINANLISPDYATKLDTLDERISGWLQPSSTTGAPGREDTLSTSQLKIYGILSNQETHRHDIDLLRQRTVQRIFVAAQLA
jgi:hypothetical protein